MEENEVMVTNDVNEVEASNVSVPEVTNEESKSSLGTTMALLVGGGFAIYGAGCAAKKVGGLLKKGGKKLKTAVGNAFAKKEENTATPETNNNDSEEDTDE